MCGRMAGLCIVGLILFAPPLVHASPIHDAAKQGNVVALAEALEQGASPNESDGLATPLYYAVTREHPKAVELLLQKGADPNFETTWGPAILSAAFNGDAPTLEMLLGRGANPNVATRTETPLHLASQIGCLRCVELLVRGGADVNALTKFREPPIHFAMKAGHSHVAEFLLANGYVTPRANSIIAALKRGSLNRGAEIYAKECFRCHDASPQRRTYRGPHLRDIVGRSVSSVEGFKYSLVMRSRGGTWDYESLNQFLFEPTRVLPGTDMGSAGVQNDDDRRDLIVFLRAQADSPRPLPD